MSPAAQATGISVIIWRQFIQWQRDVWIRVKEPYHTSIHHNNAHFIALITESISRAYLYFLSGLTVYVRCYGIELILSTT